ncbi:hypothetical protein EI983_10405 [Roseovarius faecimaris]|uniref:Ferrochelatase n=1 Tax=Roseovarius faecimaris TaxID=2494550 RepID=A0A6I6INP1_9RHOB|nr:hypothetical protein [Roseovarius faecimaris]QGX98659.1 hypothetical protein EI983_10405 [Roseovarius faecimaris]
MKYILVAAFFAASPALAGSLSDPVVTPDVVVAEAVADSSNADGLIIAVWLATLLAAAGGAF